MNGIQIKSRGQLFSSDALLSLVVFGLVLAIVAGIYFQWGYSGEAANQATQRDAAGVRVLHTLLLTNGTPSYWEMVTDRNTIQQVGLRGHVNGISPQKWESFVDWNADDYPSLARAMGLPDYNFYLSILDVNRNMVGYAGVSPGDVNNVSVVVLPSVFRQAPVMVQLQVYST